jgi:hypothetical protein
MPAPAMQLQVFQSGDSHLKEERNQKTGCFDHTVLKLLPNTPSRDTMVLQRMAITALFGLCILAFFDAGISSTATERAIKLQRWLSQVYDVF